MLNTMHLFAGRGGGLLADLILGHNPIIAVEWNHEACENLREKAVEGWYPNLHVWEGDVRLFDSSEYQGQVDCIHAGFPCQDLSIAGKQKGLGEGTRSGLYREVLRIAGALRTKYIFLENVTAIINNGLGTVLADLTTLGYDCRWCVVSASDVGANHQRDRWWCLATFRDTNSFRREEGVFSQKSFIRRTQIQSKRSGSTSGIYETRVSTERNENTSLVANTNSEHDFRWPKSQQSNSQSRKTRNKSEGCSDGTLSNTNGTGHNSKEQSSLRETQDRQRFANNTGNADWWKSESTICRVVDGVSYELHKDEIVSMLFGLGNAQVPLACAVAWKILTKDLTILKGTE